MHLGTTAVDGLLAINQASGDSGSVIYTNLERDSTNVMIAMIAIRCFKHQSLSKHEGRLLAVLQNLCPVLLEGQGFFKTSNP